MATNALHSQATEGASAPFRGFMVSVSSVWPGASGRCARSSPRHGGGTGPSNDGGVRPGGGEVTFTPLERVF
eukprot:1934816-Prymnesium_polylepis.1